MSFLNNKNLRLRNHVASEVLTHLRNDVVNIATRQKIIVDYCVTSEECANDLSRC
jgi:hypothetical protein